MNQPMKAGGTLIGRACLLICLALPAPAQQWDWVQRFQGGASAARAIGLDAQENVYLAGTFTGTNQIGTNRFVSAGGSDVFTAQFSPAGEVIWAIATGGTNEDYIRSFLVTSNGTLFVLGRFTIDPALLAAPATNVSDTSSNVLVLARIDAGRFSWFETFPAEVSTFATAAALGPDGSLWMIGASNRVFLTQYHQDGARLSSMNVGNSPFWPTALAVGHDERLFLAANFFREVDLGGTNLMDAGFAYFTAGLEATGQTRWAWKVAPVDRVVTALARGFDNSVLTVASYDSAQQGYTVLIKHSAEGALLWEREYTGPVKSLYTGRGAAIDRRGAIHVIGDALRQFGSSLYYRTAAWLITVDADGRQVSEQFVKSDPLHQHNGGLAIAVNFEADVFIAGSLMGIPTFGTNIMGEGTTAHPNAFVARRPTLQPAINVTRAGTNVLLDWPRTALPFALQRSNGTGSNTWSDVTTPPQEGAARKQVLVPAATGVELFRLRMTNEPPIRHGPVISGLWSVDAWAFLGRPSVYLSASNSMAGPTFRATAEDADEEALTFLWFNPGTGVHLTNGITVLEQRHATLDFPFYVVTLSDPALTFGTGTHRISFVASDGLFSVTNSLLFEVIPVLSALNELIAAVEAATAGPERLRLVEPLNAARLAMETGAYDVAAQQLEDFQARVESSTELSAAQKALFNQAAQAIHDAIP